MALHIETLSLISTVQTAVLALMLWAGTHPGASVARNSLHLRAAAFAVEAAGWGTLAAHAYLSPTMLLLGGNALNLIAMAMSVIALRMLLGEPLRWRLVLAIGVIGWLGVGWFGLVHPDYRYRVLWGSVAITLNMLLNVEALTSGFRWHFSRARNVLLLFCVMAVVLVVWRSGQLWFGSDQPLATSVPSATNFIYISLSGMQPLFASIGFLLLYNEILQQELHLLARIDSLTGVKNRLAINEIMPRKMAQSARWQQSLAVLMIDADHFKSVNDRFGHAGGDVVLCAMVASIRATLRETDVLGRVGGEEFVVLSSGTDLSGALRLGERIRTTVESTSLLVDGQALRLTVSIGVTTVMPAEQDSAAVLHRADQALYAAKRAGRNRVVSASMDDDQVATLPA
ncbi:GGDEF domain-containing protein [Rhodanobacter ginsengisoli]|uniref:diguanylate cyclase n=1 Tax=Rhodanobacter ginsengisoli TaxID=418646 RepID=A0ABW0QP08_9GAMM